MKLKVFAIFAIVFASLTACWVMALKILPRPFEANWIEAIYKRKEAAAASVRGPKVLIIGGSGTHYSYSAQTVSRLTGLHTINLGTHAGLGGEYILHRAKDSLNPGDIAVLALEQQLAHPARPSTVLSTFVVTSDLGYLTSAPLRDVPALLFGYPPVELLRQAAARSVPYSSPLYRAETVTAWGDESVNIAQNKLPYMRETVRTLPALSLATVPNPSKPAQFLIEFAQWASRNKVRVIQTWPATTFRPQYLTQVYKEYFGKYAETYRRVGFEVIGRPEHYFLPEEEMLDSMYHADNVGADKISRAFAEDLCRVVTCSSQR